MMFDQKQNNFPTPTCKRAKQYAKWVAEQLSKCQVRLPMALSTLLCILTLLNSMDNQNFRIQNLLVPGQEELLCDQQ